MWLNELCKRWQGRAAAGRRGRQPAAQRHGLRLRLERLEDRTVPANFTAASASELIADINAANLTAEADTITLVAGKTFALTDQNNATDGRTGLPVIAATENLTIIGNGDVIERTASATPFRLFDVAAGSALTLENLTLQGGSAVGSGAASRGGAVYNQGTLTLDGVTVQNNTALCGDPSGNAAGGGLYSSGVLVMTNSTVTKNVATGGRGEDSHGSSWWFVPAGPGGIGYGGGLYVGGGLATISNSSLTGNTAIGGDGGNWAPHTPSSAGGDGGNGFGGGVYAAGGDVTLHNSSVTGNMALGGAGGTGTRQQPDGKAGQGVGGGIYLDNTYASVAMDALTKDHVKRNKASTIDNNIHGAYDVIL
jgi:hypothetical protein